MEFRVTELIRRNACFRFESDLRKPVAADPAKRVAKWTFEELNTIDPVNCSETGPKINDCVGNEE
jgi:hypothetical protein